MNTENGTLIFVYGTLRQGAGPAHVHLLQYAEYIAHGFVPGRLYDLGDYPGLVPPDCNYDIVRGEVYQLFWPEALRALDCYEGCSESDPIPHEYRREVVQVHLETGDRCRAWAYWYQGPIDQPTRIDSGDYIRFLRLRHRLGH